MFDNFSRTSAYNLIKAVAGFVAVFGVVIDADLIVQNLEQISAAFIALWAMLDGAFGVFLRKLTDRPVAGFFGLRK